jgi:DHA2 family multidrug resistance protein
VLFVIASWLCGLAPNIGIADRLPRAAGPRGRADDPAVADAAAGQLPAAKAGVAMAMWAMTVLVAPVVGPLLGGWITDNISWPWIFYINIPVGLLAALVTWSIYRKRDPGPAACRSTSWAWACWCCGSVRCRSCSTRARSSTGSTRPDHHAGGGGRGGVRCSSWPGSSPRRTRSSTCACSPGATSGLGTVSLSVAYGLFFGNVVLMPLWLQQYMGYTSHLGRHGAGTGGGAGDGAVALVGKTLARSTRASYATVAFIVFGIVLWMRSRFNTSGRLLDHPDPDDHPGRGDGVLLHPAAGHRVLGPGAGPHAGSRGPEQLRAHHGGRHRHLDLHHAWENRAVMHHAQLTESLTSTNNAATLTLSQLGAAGYSNEQALATVNRLLDQQAYTMAATDIFWLSSIIFIALIGLVWFAKPKMNAGGADVGGAH